MLVRARSGGRWSDKPRFLIYDAESGKRLRALHIKHTALREARRYADEGVTVKVLEIDEDGNEVEVRS